MTAAWRSIYFNTLNLGDEDARLVLDAQGNFRANSLSINSSGSATLNGTLNIISGSQNGNTPLNITSATSNTSIFNVRELSTNFGSLASAGGFEGRNSYFGEEYNVAPVTATQTCTGNTTLTHRGWARGDMGNHNTAAITCGTNANDFAGEFNFSAKLGATTASDQCQASYQTGTVNGVERLLAQSTTTASNNSNCVETLAATQSTSNKIYLLANRPVMTLKVKMNSLTSGNNNTRVLAGMGDLDSAGTNTTGASPANGVYFSNCSTESSTSGSVSGCSNTTWYGHSYSGGTDRAVTCSTGSGTNALTSNFSYLRIEVRSSTDIRFFADYNVSDGINESECGTGVVAGPSAAMAPFVNTAVASNINQTVSIDIDYIRSWQDDSVPLPETPEDNPESPVNEADAQSPAPISPDSADAVTADSFFSFLGATSEDTVFNHNVYVKGTLFADKIVANQIEGLSVFTNQLASLQKQLGGTGETSAAEDSNSPQIQLVPTSLNLSDGLVIGGDAKFNGNAFFYKLVTFVEKTVFNNDLTLNAHLVTGGNQPAVKTEESAGITTAPPDNEESKLAAVEVDGNDLSGGLKLTLGDDAAAGKLLSVTFDKPYQKAPRILLTPSNDKASQLHYYVKSTSTGFSITTTDDNLTPGIVLQFNYWAVE
jgi:hypothetical protein